VELKQIKELMASMEKASIRRLRIKEKDGYELELERKEEVVHSPSIAIPHTYSELPHRFPPQLPPHHLGHAMEASGHLKDKEASGKYITSPLVGTVYQARTPEDPPFVKIGDVVDEQTIVCIVEAMKVMNEVKAGISGTIAEILVGNTQPVEFGTKIFKIV
jgi:acetyl-CoA carboxylase biotin carboxyl carrier protein